MSCAVTHTHAGLTTRYRRKEFYDYSFFYKNNFIRTRSSFFAQNLRTVKNNPSLSKRTKS